MKKNLVLSVILTGVLSSCYFVNDIFDPPEENVKTLQERAEYSVKDHLIKTSGNLIYQPYGFGEITIHKPQDIVDLEILEEKRKKNPSATLDTAIAQKKRYIQENKIERTLDIDHFFTLKDSAGTFKIFETSFILNDTLGVKDVSGKIMLNTTEEYEDALTYFFFEYNIFSTPSYYDSRQLSSNFYAFFKNELENRSDRLKKSAFLLHVLKLTREVKESGEFEQQTILEKMVKNFIREERKDIVDYEPLTFSGLFQTTEAETEEIKGYHFFHKFIGTFNDKRDTNAIMVEFSKYYEIDNIFQLDRPYGVYFNQQ